MKTVTYNVPNISCGHCVRTIQDELGELPGVQTVEANKDTRLVTVSFDEPVTDEKLRQLLAEINYPAAV